MIFSHSTASPRRALLTLLLSLISGLASANDGAWIGFEPNGRVRQATIYDPVRNQMVVFGGAGCGNSYFNDVWTLSMASNPVWSQLSPAGTPPGVLYAATAVYDPVRQRMLIFGGVDFDSYRDDVWALSLSGTPTWSLLAPTGTPPSGRAGPSATYDPIRDRLLIFGGEAGFPFKNDVWSLSLSGTPAWSLLSPSGGPPSERTEHSAIYDPMNDRMLVFGGQDGSTYLNDVWALSLSGSLVWSPLAPSGAPPNTRSQHTAVYDAAENRMVVFGGFGVTPMPSLYNDVWTLSLSMTPAWSQLAPMGSPPSARAGHGAIYEPAGDRMVVFGGGTSLLGADVWSLSLSATPAWSAPSNPPYPRQGHSAIYDPMGDRMVVFGGYDDGVRNDLWSLSLSDDPAWSQVAASGTPPGARERHTAIYDPVRVRMVLFGGSGSPDVWALSLSGSPAWNQLSPSGTPPNGRDNHAAIYDPVRDRMVTFGGSDVFNNPSNEVRALSLSGSPAWSQLSPSGTPPTARAAHTAIYDPVRDRMIVFGGVDAASYRNDVWALSLSSPAWSQLFPSGTPPVARVEQTAIYDPIGDRMVVFGGGDQTFSLRDDVWALSLSGTSTWSQLSPSAPAPTPRSDHTAIYHPAGDQMIVSWGSCGGVWALRLAGPTDVPFSREPAATSRIVRVRPNPSAGRQLFEVDMKPGQPATLSVYNVVGQLVWSRRLFSPSGGLKMVEWDGGLPRGGFAPPGIYFARLDGRPGSGTRFARVR